MATQSMRFKHESNSFEIRKAGVYSCDVVIVVENVNTLHTREIPMSEDNLIELRRWVSRQIQEIRSKKSTPKK